MQKFNISNMIRGWFIGNFKETVYKTSVCEVGVKKYFKNDYENAHYHKIATEITYIISGKVSFNGIDFLEGDIIIIEPNEVVKFKCLEDAVTVVVKLPGELNDKYEVHSS